MESGQSRFGTLNWLLMLAGVVVVVAGLKAAQDLILPFLVAVFLSVLAAPAVSWLMRHHVPRFVSVSIVVVVMVGVLTGLGAMLGGTITDFTESLPVYKSKLAGLGGSIQAWFDRQGYDVSLERQFDQLNLGSVLDLLRRGLGGLMSAASNTLLVVLTIVFILLEATGFPVKLRAALGRSDADISRFAAVTVEVQHYLALKTIVSAVTGIVIGLWCVVLGVDFALLWGLVAFLLNYIPGIGSILAAVPAVLLCIVQLGAGRALVLAIGYLVVNTVIGNIIEPQVMGHRLGLSPLVVFISLIFWGWVWGPVGMLLSVPLTMIAKILMESSEDTRWLAVLLGSTSGAERRLNALEDAEDRGDTVD